MADVEKDHTNTSDSRQSEVEAENVAAEFVDRGGDADAEVFTSAVEESAADGGGVTRAVPWYRRGRSLVGIGLLIAAVIAALVFMNGRANHLTASSPTSVADAASTQTIKQYIEDNQITSAPVKLGDPGAPTIVIALPQGWSDLGVDTPTWAYGAVQLDTASEPNDPPTIMVLLSKLTGDVDSAKILESAPNELKNLPDYKSASEATSSTLSGFDAVQLAGLYTGDGKQRTIAQKTVVIPANDAVYVLQLNADALKSDAVALMEATDVIDKQTKITP